MMKPASQEYTEHIEEHVKRCAVCRGIRKENPEGMCMEGRAFEEIRDSARRTEGFLREREEGKS